jgi:hypothetical protein
MKHFFVVIAAMLIAICPRLAFADEWGCEVLLCAASSTPSWHGVPECHPPMDRLISEMKKPGFSWPTCPEGGADKPGYEAFAECPAGWSPAAGEHGRNGFANSELSRCTRAVSDCHDGRRQFGRAGEGARTEVRDDGTTRVYDGGRGCGYREYMARPRRQQPYFFDIRDPQTQVTSRFYFDLSK